MILLPEKSYYSNYAHDTSSGNHFFHLRNTSMYAAYMRKTEMNAGRENEREYINGWVRYMCVLVSERVSVRIYIMRVHCGNSGVRFSYHMEN